MIKLATVFSGIGAVEHALNRMDISTEIIFACDNGDIDIFSKKINVDMDQIEEELSVLTSLINNMKLSEEDSYELQLLNMLDLAKREFVELNEVFDNLDVANRIYAITVILKDIIDTSNLNKTRVNLCSLLQRKLVWFLS